MSMKGWGDSKNKKEGAIKVSIQNRWLINIAMVVASWLTLPLMSSRSIKRFLPATVMILIVEMIHARFGKKRRWWVFYRKPDSILFNEFPFQIGPFVVTSLWILKWTYGNFRNFLLANVVNNAFFAFVVTEFGQRIKWYKLVKFNRLEFFLYFYQKAFLLYFFQYLIEKRRSLHNVRIE
ncbi:hypothetical protein ACFFK0_28180 [Paenibacillus chartarius]|uniref:Uncharacterized protein n=1 Tax=Paenibacillus chartarius TaxID=747481 RepID=A0ABV6DUE1_9BACL